jgi:hypothetical protein
VTEPVVGVEVPIAPAPSVPRQRPEVLVGAAFAGGVVLALLLKRAGRVD